VFDKQLRLLVMDALERNVVALGVTSRANRHNELAWRGSRPIGLVDLRQVVPQQLLVNFCNQPRAAGQVDVVTGGFRPTADFEGM